MAIKHNARRAQGLVAAVAIIAVHLAVAVPAGAAEAIAVRLTPVPIDAQTRAQVVGAGSATGEIDGRRLELEGSFSGLRAAATVAGLHEGAAKGVRGPQIAAITVPASTNGSFAVDVTLTAQQVESLRQGRLYIQIHSESAPDGNLWGWLVQ